MTDDGASANGREQVRDESVHPESNLAGDEENVDLKHLQSSLLRFVDRPLPIQAVLSLGAQYCSETEETIAHAVDELVQRGFLRFADGMVGRPDPELDAEAAAPRDMGRVYKSWQRIVRRHPEWTITVKDDAPLDIEMADPAASMEGLKGRLQYDEASVRPEDREEFEEFLRLDKMIEDYEASGGRDAMGALRSIALWRMAGGRVLGIGIVRGSLRRVEAGSGPGRGDIVHALAEEIAMSEHNSALVALPLDKQMEIMHKAEEQAVERYPLTPVAQFGADDMEQPPAPDPEKAPNGWEAISTPDGKKTWRSKTDPNTTLERPDDNASF